MALAENQQSRRASLPTDHLELENLSMWRARFVNVGIRSLPLGPTAHKAGRGPSRISELSQRSECQPLMGKVTGDIGQRSCVYCCKISSLGCLIAIWLGCHAIPSQMPRWDPSSCVGHIISQSLNAALKRQPTMREIRLMAQLFDTILCQGLLEHEIKCLPQPRGRINDQTGQLFFFFLSDTHKFE